MSYAETDDWGLMELLKDFELFQKGRRRKISNVLHSVDDFLELNISIFDYEYVIGKNKKRNRKQQTVFFLRSRSLGLPEIYMRPENFLHRIANYLNLSQDIDFEEFPKFSKQYLLQGEDEEYIRHIINEEVLQFFTKEKGWTLEAINFFLMFHHHNKLLKPWEIKQLFKKGMKLHEILEIK
ncbi:MAG: hypothetical protein ACJAUH_000322 [Saprospiraceae bacterium]|jgi:hypothetical protein|tara:strand:- start:1123 stop:1665 length:543 start_codon:yes stop_codon:yes gene_type:complete